jgi:Protein of unknown function (DUF3568)
MHRLLPSRPCESPSTGPADRRRRLGRAALLLVCLPLAGCVAVGATLAGLGFSHQMSGMQYRTFTEPLPKVSRATLAAFKRMSFKLEAVQPTKTGELIKGTAADRRFEVELEALTANTTRMRALARNQLGMVVDASVAQEIIRQAEKALAPDAGRKLPRNSSAAAAVPRS